MYLKRLELCGFKSFADKTRLEFEPGITAIIGPNGCGKSNTSDAIRWCLGEQSARSMRSHQMLDVVFGGSQSRQTTGMAEVALTFDNSQNVLPIDYTEVTVTRRLFRSGESEYFINKAQCRLKDIRDLFLDTGIGSEGYSIIEQGKVEFLLSARPEERREMFEEAAGVSKYKVRREETLRKLQKVEVDMNRVNDMLSLLKEQISTLDAAARKAKQYKKHKEDLRRIEIASIVQQSRKIDHEIERIKGDLAPRSEEFEHFNTTLDQTEAAIAQFRVEQVEKDEQYVRLHDEHSRTQSEINLCDERIQQAGQRELELSDRQSQLVEENATAGTEIERQETERVNLQNLWQELTQRVAQLEQEFKNKEALIYNVRVRVGEYCDAENGLKSRLFEMAGRKTELHNERNRLSSYQVHCQARIASLEKELARLREQFGPKNDEIQARENELIDLRQRLADVNVRYQDIGSRVTELENERGQLLQRQTALKEKQVSLESKSLTLKEWEASDPLRTTMRTVLAQGIAGIWSGPVSNFIASTPGSENIVAAAFGEKLNYMIADSAAAARQAIKYLEENNLGRLTFVILERLPELSTLPSAPAGAATIMSLVRFEPTFEKIVRYLCADTFMEGQSIFSGAVVEGGGNISFEKPVLVEDQLRRLEDELTLLRQELSRAGDEYIALDQNLASIVENRKTLEFEQHRLSAQIEFIGQQQQSKRDELQYLQKEISVNENDIVLQQQEEAKVVEQLKTIGDSLQSLEKDELTGNEQLQQIERDIAAQRDEENRLVPLLTEAKVAWATQSNELASREREEQKLKETIETLLRQREQGRQELAAIELKLAEQKVLQESESAKLQGLHQELQKNDVELELSLAERQNLTQRLEEKNGAVHQLRQQVENLKQEMHNLQMEQRSFELQSQNLSVRLQEDYAHTIAEVSEEFATTAVNEEEIARLKRRIEALGAVNLAAPEEYAALEERYNFLLTQQQDLFKAKEDLHQVITKINQNTRENFRKTYDQVRENFKSLYRQLFEGGEADLMLTDENNLLESGVDIWAQPPGKKLQNIALLSGGEKALTAIALLFAFFMVRPSPFCILDEVDAPLDDANIGRYINMIKHFSEKSQFLVITHNKRTMEMADILYGVTMEELGVSKIISVRLNREKENLPASA
jgi:chromosome segregation protein